MAANENVFNFDVSPFLAGVNKIGEGMGRIEGNAKKFGSTITGAVNKSVNGLILKVVGLIAAFKTAGAVLKEMPEVGQAFGLAKDIFLKNLLWPLRQQVMPLLQKMLDWVRDNRAQFVKWGTTVANIFRTVVVVAKTLWEVFKSLVDMVGSAFQKAFNTNFKSFDEFLNVLSFKISAVIIFLGMLAKQLVTDFKPAFEWIIDMGSTIIRFFLDLVKAWTSSNEQGKSLWTVLDAMKTTFELLSNFIGNAVKGLTEGFLPAVKDAMTPLTNIVTSINRLLVALGFNDSEGIRGAFKALGGILGTAFVAALSTVATALDLIVTSLVAIAQLGNVLDKVFKGDWIGAFDEVKKIGGTFSGFGKRTAENGNAINAGVSSIVNPEKVHDGIITKNGKVIHTDSDDNIFASKTLPGKGKSTPNVNIGPFYISVTEGDAEKAGRNFGNGLKSTFRDNVSSARLAEGR